MEYKKLNGKLSKLSTKCVDTGMGLERITAVLSKKSNVGILVCGFGTGMAISANKFKKIRAAVCYNIASTRLSRMHNNANILALGSRLTNKQNAIKLVNVFLSTKFEGGRHLRRVKKI